MSTNRILLGLTGLAIDGGIASVGRCVTRALDEVAADGGLARVDRVLLLDEPDAAPPVPPHAVQRLCGGSQPRFVLQWLRTYARHRHDLAFFDIVGLARAASLPLPGLPPRRTAIFVHGIELSAANDGARADALKKAWRILANSEFTANQVIEMHPELADRVRTVPLCIAPEKLAAWSRHDAPADTRREPAALIVGRMWSVERGKGHEELIAAWPSVERAVPGAELWIAGGGDDVPRLEGLAQASGARGIRFLGRISDDALAERYRRAALYAMPSRQEGFGLVYAEAMWFGTPCLGSHADAAAQLIDGGATGRLVPYGDVDAIATTVSELLSQPERTRAMGDRARERARKHFTFERFRNDLLDALELPPC